MKAQPIPFFPPGVDPQAGPNAMAVLEGGALAPDGTFVQRLERSLLDRTGASAILALRSAPYAYLLAFRLAGLSPGDYLLAPTLGTATACHVARWLGADPILFDAEPASWQLDLDLLEEFLMNYTLLNERDQLILKRDQRVIRGILLRHWLGIPCDMDRLAFIANRFHLPLWEDASEALGSHWQGRAAGTFGHPGILVPAWQQPAGTFGGFLLVGEGKEKIPPAIESKGQPGEPDLRMDNLTAAVALAHWEGYCRDLGRIERLYDRYFELLGKIRGLTWPSLPELAEPSRDQFAIRLPQREALLKKFARQGIGYAKPDLPVDQLPDFRDCLFIQRTAQAKRLAQEVVRLPLHADLSELDQERVVHEIRHLKKVG